MSDDPEDGPDPTDPEDDPKGHITVRMNPVELEVYTYLCDHVELPMDAHELQDTLMVELSHLTKGQIRHSLLFLDNLGIIKWEGYNDDIPPQ